MMEQAQSNKRESTQEQEYPLSIATVAREGNIDHHRHHGDASVSHTIANMAKTCLGTGILALPFAAKQGGILLHVFGLAGVGIWNVATVELLCMCHDLLDETSPGGNDIVARESMDQESQPLVRSSASSTAIVSADAARSYESIRREADLEEVSIPRKTPPKGTTTLVTLAWYAFGQKGANLLDIFMVLYLIGVTVTYLNAMRSFLGDTCFTTGVGFVDSLLLIMIMGPLSVVPHTGHLAKASVMGLVVLLATFMIISWYGFVGEQFDDNAAYDAPWHVLTGDPSIVISPRAATTNASIPGSHGSSFWLPINGLAGVSQWFGCVVFGFGLTPLAFNFREAMQEPHHLLLATRWAILLVASSYALVGLGLLYLYPNIDGDVLHELPTKGWLPTLTRLAMVLVVLVTAPLLIVPCGELLERKFLARQDQEALTPQSAWRLRALVRWSICVVCAAISTLVPGFVNVLSFVGCCCVAVVGFCLPPFLHLILSLQKSATRECNGGTTQSTRAAFLKTMTYSILIDVSLLLWGVAATAVSTTYTFQEIMSTPGPP